MTVGFPTYIIEAGIESDLQKILDFPIYADGAFKEEYTAPNNIVGVFDIEQVRESVVSDTSCLIEWSVDLLFYLHYTTSIDSSSESYREFSRLICEDIIPKMRNYFKEHYNVVEFVWERSSNVRHDNYLKSLYTMRLNFTCNSSSIVEDENT